VEDWNAHFAREEERYRDGESRLPEDPDERQRQLTRMGNAAGGAGLALLMAGRGDDAAAWLRTAAERYRESWEGAPPGSWGRPIGDSAAAAPASNAHSASSVAAAQSPASNRALIAPIGRPQLPGGAPSQLSR